jgi:hypothetical protein
MSIGEEVGLDHDRLAGDALDGKSAAIELRFNILDNDSRTALGDGHGRNSPVHEREEE